MRFRALSRVGLGVVLLVLVACGGKQPPKHTAADAADAGPSEPAADTADAPPPADTDEGGQPDAEAGEPPETGEPPVAEEPAMISLDGVSLPERCADLPAIPVKADDTLRFVTINTDGGTKELRHDFLESSDSLGAQEDHLVCLGRLVGLMQADVVYMSEVHSYSRYWRKWDMPEAIRSRAEEVSEGWSMVFGQSCLLPKSEQEEHKGRTGNAFLVRERAAEATPVGGGFLEADFDRDPDNGLERVLTVPLPTEMYGEKEVWDAKKSQSRPCYSYSDDRYRHNRGRQKSAILSVVFGIEVIGLHLSPGRRNEDQRTVQLEHLAKTLRKFRKRVDKLLGSSDPRPVVVMGDLNEGDEVFARFKKSMGDSGWSNATAGITYERKIDHIFIKGLELVRAAELHLPGFLNHHVMYVDVRLPNR